MAGADGEQYDLFISLEFHLAGIKCCTMQTCLPHFVHWIWTHLMSGSLSKMEVSLLALSGPGQSVQLCRVRTMTGGHCGQPLSPACPQPWTQPQWHYAAGCEEHGVHWSFPTTSTCLKSTFWSQRPRPSTPSPVQPWTGGGQCAAEPLCCATNISDAHGHVVPNWGSAAPRPACLLWWGGVCSRWPCRRAPDFTGRDRQSICCIYLFYHYRRSISKCVQKDPLFLQGYTTPCSQLNRNNLTSPEKADGKYKCIFSFTILYTYFPEWRTKT